jgi:ribonuclease G
MYVSSTPHECKVALVEDDQLAELFFERENEYTLAGSIYKGRVTRVLPGMQSAFVDVGLERDAFLYVSDFLEVPEDEDNEFDEIAVQRPEAFVTNRPAPEPRLEFKTELAVPHPEPGGLSAGEEPEDEMAGAESHLAEGDISSGADGEEEPDRELRGNRRRRRGRRGRSFPESKFARPNPEVHLEAPDPGAGHLATFLPGESISKYRPRGDRPAEGPFSPTVGTLVPEAAELAASAPGNEAMPEPELGSEPDLSPPVGSSPALDTLPAQAEHEFHVPESSTPRTPMVLPGESIAKYRSRPEPMAEPVPEARSAGAGESGAKLPLPREEPFPEVSIDRERRSVPLSDDRDSQAEQGRGSSRFVVLPGESIAKYQARPAERVSGPAEGAEKKAGGESLAPRATPPSATFVIESEPWTEAQETYSPTPAVEPAPQAAVEAAVIAAPAEAKPHPSLRSGWGTPALSSSSVDTFAESEVESGRKSEFLAQPTLSAEVHVQPASASAGFPEAVQEEEGPQDGEDSVSEEVIPGNVVADSAAGRNGALEPAAPVLAKEEHPAPGLAAAEWREHDFGAAGAGTLEHEEIEGDETDLHPPGEEESDSEFVEMEEESFERGDSVAAPSAQLLATEAQNGELLPGLSEAVKETEVERTILAHAYETEEAQEFDGDLSFEEEELVEEEDAALPEEHSEGGMAGRAQVRGPQPTSAYHRAEPAFDRRRGRRPARRMIRRQEPARPQAQISDLLKEGQEVLVQIAKEPIGKKGARITSHIALPGRFLVYMPTVNHIGVSRKIVSDEERQRLKRIMLSEREGGHGGFIVRTAAAGVGEDELRADIRFLKNLWTQIRQRSESGKAPALIYHDLNLVERVLRDLVTSEFSQIWVDSEQEYERIMNFANRFQPSLMRRVKLYTKETPLFDQFGIHEELDKALKSKVWLKSGGYIVINQTEALVAIDVNTGKYVGKTARLEDTIVKTNVDAIREIVRQIRLRDLGGIIVIDFIDMDERKNRQKVMQALEEALKYDRSPSKVLAFNDFGLVAITRKRVKQSLERTLGSPCPYCSGSGFVKSVTTVCNEIYTELRKMHRHLSDGDVVNLRINPEVAKALKANGGRRLQDLEELSGRSILIKADPLLHQEQFDIL